MRRKETRVVTDFFSILEMCCDVCHSRCGPSTCCFGQGSTVTVLLSSVASDLSRRASPPIPLPHVYGIMMHCGLEND